MNPRVSRSSALASKATGFPIARIGTKVAVGYTLDELPNDITRVTPASFEPVLDYVVVKIPRFAFEKFPAADPTLTTQMKSVGEAMAIGRTFKEAFQKGLRGLEIDRPGWVAGATAGDDRLQDESLATVLAALRTPTPERVFQIKRALQLGASVDQIAERSRIDPWFLHQMAELVEAEAEWQAGGRADGRTVGRADGRVQGRAADEVAAHDERRAKLRKMKRLGFSDRQLADLSGVQESEIRRGTSPPGPASGLQDGRHLCRRVPLVHPVSLLQLRRGERGPGERQPHDRHPGQRPQPDRAGGRVRLLLRPGRDGLPRAGLPHGDGQLQPGDGVHRLRHLRCALLRAAHARGRARDRARRAAASVSSFSSAGRRRSGSRAGSSGRGWRSWGPRPRRSTWPRTAGGSRRSPASSAWPSRPAGSRSRSRRRWRWPRASATRCWCDRPTCSAAARWKSSTTTRRCGATSPARCGWRPSTRC